jgi:hypothetical protein
MTQQMKVVCTVDVATLHPKFVMASLVLTLMCSPNIMEEQHFISLVR